MYEYAGYLSICYWSFSPWVSNKVSHFLRFASKLNNINVYLYDLWSWSLREALFIFGFWFLPFVLRSRFFILSLFVFMCVHDSEQESSYRSCVASQADVGVHWSGPHHVHTVGIPLKRFCRGWTFLPAPGFRLLLYNHNRSCCQAYIYLTYGQMAPVCVFFAIVMELQSVVSRLVFFLRHISLIFAFLLSGWQYVLELIIIIISSSRESLRLFKIVLTSSFVRYVFCII